MNRKKDFVILLSVLVIDYFSVGLCLWGDDLSVFGYVFHLFLIIAFLAVVSYNLITRISHIKDRAFTKEIGVLLILDFIIWMLAIGPGLISVFGQQLGTIIITFTVFGAHLLELLVYGLSLLLAHCINKTK